MSDEPRPRYIVAEVSKSYLDGRAVNPGTVLAELFQDAANFNARRNYYLHSWKFNQLIREDGRRLVETIVAVFEDVDHIIEDLETK